MVMATTPFNSLSGLLVAVKGAGEMASGVAWRLHMAHFRVIMTEVSQPMAVRRAVCFCEAVYDGVKKVEGVEAVRIAALKEANSIWELGKIPVIVDPDLSLVRELSPAVIVEATLSKRNTGNSIHDAPLVIALGPGHVAGRDAHMVIETNRGHNLGRIITEGAADPDTGIPGDIAGYTVERVLRSPAEGLFEAAASLGDFVEKGQTVAWVSGHPVVAGVGGIVRGLIRPGAKVSPRMKLGDIDPRGRSEYLNTISDKARAIAGSVLEAILRKYNG
jgi:xanthine dehydrogenase accessory factor